MAVGMEYRFNPEILGEIFAVPAAVVDNHIKLAGSAQLKVLLWLLRGGNGDFDAESCSKAKAARKRSGFPRRTAATLYSIGMLLVFYCRQKTRI